MKILIAPDSFKESLEALDVCQAIQSGFNQVFPDADYTLLPMADGGEGTSDVLSYTLGGHWKEVVVNDPLMRPITAKYLLLPDATAVIEIAQACGLHLLTSAERNPVVASSYG
ncbi:MAG: glycerate kinase, partial [Moraxellaceae bacterium]